MAEPLTLVWAGGEHPFLLRIGELRAIDERCTDGAFAAWNRLLIRSPRLDDVYEVIRLGLIGGGMKAEDAKLLILKAEDQVGLGELIPLASAIMFRAFHRREERDEPVGEPQASDQTA